jgi:hypothetical protein
MLTAGRLEMKKRLLTAPLAKPNAEAIFKNYELFL